MSIVVGILVAMSVAGQQAEGEVAPDDKIVCKRLEDAATGSHYRKSKKVCMKKSEWRAAEQQTARALRSIRDRSGVHPNEPGGRQ